jgi:tetratricopeptide (TPR) repeat protein
MRVSDEIRRWSEELARDPASMVFVPLGDALRRRGQLEPALKVATRGLERHPYDADAHDLLARIHADRGELEHAMDEWSVALRVAPHHAGALKGMGFACFQSGRAAEAERYLVAAVAADPGDPTIDAALSRLRVPRDESHPSHPDVAAPMTGHAGAASAAAQPALAQPALAQPALAPAQDPELAFATATVTGASADARDIFADLLGDGEQTALLLDPHGYVLAGAYVVADGRDVAQEVGGALSGVSDEAHRAMRHLGLGEWSSIVFEAEVAAIAMSPVVQEGEIAIALVAAARTVPLGLVRRLLRRVSERGAAWLADSAGQTGAGR